MIIIMQINDNVKIRKMEIRKIVEQRTEMFNYIGVGYWEWISPFLSVLLNLGH